MKALQNRLHRLELATLPAKLPTIFIVKYGDDEITGFDGYGELIERQPGEPLADLERRCEQTRPDVRVWMPVYRGEK